jgi:hypothetical protein
MAALSTCQHCERSIEHRRIGERSTHEPILRWCVERTEPFVMPTYICAGHKIGTGWFIERYHEPQS